MKGNLKKLLCLVFAVALLGSLLAGCGGGSEGTPAPGDSAPKDSAAADNKDDGKDDDANADLANGMTPREETLYVGGLLWAPPTNFNPISGTSVFPMSGAGGDRTLVYETLFMYNMMNPEGGAASLEPYLGTEFSFEGDVLTVKLNQAAKFSDGEPFTAEDVVFTYEMGKTYSIWWSDAWQIFESITAVDDYTVEFKMIEGGNKNMALRQIGRVSMLPKHIWEPWMNEMEEAEVRQLENFDPIGTGPYKIMYYDDTRVVCVRDDNYWGQDESMFGELPAPKYITHILYKDNAGANTAFQNDEIDITECFIPQVWEMWEDGSPIRCYLNELPYHIPGTIPMLFINMEKPGLNNADVRRAIAYAINYPKVIELAMSGYSEDIVPSLLLPQEQEKWLNVDEELESLRWTYDEAKANEILDGLGAEKGSDGIRVLPDGTRLGPWKLECPKSFSDWTASLEIVAQSLKAVGIDAGAELPEQAVWLNHSQTGEFDIIMQRPGSYMDPSQPWARCKFIMDGSSTPAVGEQAFENFNRYKDDRASEIIAEMSATEDEAKLKELYTELDKIYLRDIPIIPLMYRPLRFYTINETTWTGWPTEDNNPDNIPPMTGFDNAAVKMLFMIENVK